MVGEKVRELDEPHVDALASSIALRGLIVPLAVRASERGRYLLVAGRHHYSPGPR
jgi:ParB-like chromosome segregation protein Spo0J